MPPTCAVLDLQRGQREGPREQADRSSGRHGKTGARLDEADGETGDERRPPHTNQHSGDRDDGRQDHSGQRLHGCRLHVFAPTAFAAASAVSIAAYLPSNQALTRSSYQVEAGFSLWPPG